jgi:hypothetical protein
MGGVSMKQGCHKNAVDNSAKLQEALYRSVTNNHLQRHNLATVVLNLAQPQP